MTDMPVSVSCRTKIVVLAYANDVPRIAAVATAGVGRQVRTAPPTPRTGSTRSPGEAAGDAEGETEGEAKGEAKGEAEGEAVSAFVKVTY